ncbi:hypothetical protein [Listeria marthii]|uniref:hypothetical protein n=1 Tax=Listeria marthii TaxID=529731 RepID=UPI0016260F50|nr:hypothetical protein [Listeria marthii]MBC2001222.1 hypothetical protein [Listeria marthii]MBC2101808.1 hypothetical protein [Listeria marthii]MBF2516251.1 hypothetical protein [Listeria marthii]MBF2535666.1 hypothetical protein [Listeria marthii]MBF2554839.1 hypothetical protein [Listeria marthii]
MRKFLTAIFFLTFLLLAGCSAQNDKEAAKPEKEVKVTKETKISKKGSIDADYNIPEDSKELENKSEDIVKVKLVKNKKIGDYDKEKMEYSSTISEVEVLETYKGTFKKGDKIDVSEPWYLNEGAYESIENYIALEKEQEYTLFLRGGHDSEKLSSIISMSYGKFNEDLKETGATLSDFENLGEVEAYNFISEEEEEVKNYTEIKEDVLKEFND